MADVHLLCPNNHEILKSTKLGVFRGHLHRKTCGKCDGEIDRHVARRMCSKKCSYQVCEECFGKHWVSIIRRAKATTDPARRQMLLKSVPREYQETAAFVDAAQSRPPKATTSDEPNTEQSTSSFRPSTVVKNNNNITNNNNNNTINTEEQANPYPERPTVGWEIGEFVACTLVWVVATPLTAFSFYCLVNNQDGYFQYVWLNVAFVYAFVYLILVFFFFVLRKKVVGGAEVAWKTATFLGTANFVEHAFSVWVMREVTFQYRTDLRCVMTPPLAYLVSLYLGQEDYGNKWLIAAVAVISVGGLFLWMPVSTEGHIEIEFAMVPLVLLASIAGAFRLSYTQKELQPMEDDLEPSPLLLAVRMAPATFFSGLEMTTIAVFFKVDAYVALREAIFDHSLQHPGYAILAVCGASVGSTFMILSQLRMVQMSSATLVGFMYFLALVPMSFVIAEGLVVLHIIGLALVLVGASLYGYARFYATLPPVEDDEENVALPAPAPAFGFGESASPRLRTQPLLVPPPPSSQPRHSK